jgi:hypothetical protein
VSEESPFHEQVCGVEAKHAVVRQGYAGLQPAHGGYKSPTCSLINLSHLSGAVWHRGQAQDLPIVQMLRQPTVLGFEVENLSEVHQGKEHNQPRMLIHEGMATMGTSALGLYKVVKQGPEKSDIVGEGWQSHQGTSWEMGVFPQRGLALPTMSSLNTFVHTPQLIKLTIP